MSDRAGNQLQSARLVTLRAKSTTLSDELTRSDRIDFYKTTLKARSRFMLNLTGAGANADVELIQDLNGNGQVETGEVVASSRAAAGTPDSIDITGLAAGTYFVRVFSRGGQVNYQLSLSAKATNATSYTYEVIEQTNAFRQQNGLLPLALNTQLANAAQSYSHQMAVGDFFSHTGNDGSTPDSRIRKAGYRPRTWAENLAAGQSTPTEVVQAWIASDGHRENLLRPQLQEIGVGFFTLTQDTGTQNYHRYWTQDFGTPLTTT